MIIMIIVSIIVIIIILILAGTACSDIGDNALVELALIFSVVWKNRRYRKELA